MLFFFFCIAFMIIKIISVYQKYKDGKKEGEYYSVHFERIYYIDIKMSCKKTGFSFPY